MHSLNLIPGKEEERVRKIENYIFKIQNDDKNALANLYEEIRIPVYSFALSIVKNPSVAEDILQDTIIKIYQSSNLYKAKGKPIAWILTITKNNALMKIREQNKIADLSDDDWNNISKEENLNKEELLLLKSSLNELNVEEREIINLYALSGLKHREIAKLLDIPLATVLSKYHRAIKKLRKIMS